MKYLFNLLMATVLSLALMITSCKKDQPIEQQPNFFGLEEAYHPNEAASIMTLAAIAYVAEGKDMLTIKDSIGILLKDATLETKGDWELIWGPGITNTNSNLVYIAKYAYDQPATYAMVVRGTSIYSFSDIHQDADVFELVSFTYGLAGDSVAHGSMEGLDLLLATEDPHSGHTLKQFLPSITANETSKMFITGHSQGGALAPLLAYWFVTSSGVAEHFNLETYAFAGPSVGNESFVQNFFISMPESTYFSMVSNSLDIVPYFWARFDQLVPMEIPAPVPLGYQIVLTGISEDLNLKNIKYVQLDDQIDIGNFPPSDTLGGIQWYNHWVMKEHNHNNYLILLGAKPI